MNVRSWKAMWRNRRSREAIYSTSEYWDSKATEYDGDAASMWPNNHLNAHYHRQLVAVLGKLLPDLDGLKILDVGCGTGQNSRYLAGRGALVTGIDFSPKAIEIALRRSAGANPEYRLQSLFELQDDSVFDIVFSWASVTLACRSRSDVSNALTRMAACLKPTGMLLLCEPIHKGFLHRVLDMDIAEFRALLAECGFRVEYMRHLCFWPMRLLLAYVQWPRVLTSAGYYIGEGVMSVLGRRAFGDYQVIRASIGNRGAGGKGASAQ